MEHSQIYVHQYGNLKDNWYSEGWNGDQQRQQQQQQQQQNENNRKDLLDLVMTTATEWDVIKD